MWVLSWKKYKLSKGATALSVIGALVRYGGVLSLFSGMIPAALICIAIGCGFHFLAENVNHKAWIKAVKEKGFEQEIRNGNLNIAMQLYNGNNSKKAREYICSLNPAIATQLQQSNVAK